MWDSIFGIANGWAMLAWAVLIFAPRGPLAGSFVMYAGVGVLCLAYVVLLGTVLAKGGGQAADFTTIAGVQTIFASEAGATIGWVHYLALDLFAGLWIAKDADAKAVSRWVQAPVLLLAFFAGPAGLLIWLAVRENRARAAARAAGVRAK